MAVFYYNHEAKLYHSAMNPNPDELYHYGVKGMKWGKHKKADYYAIKNLNARKKYYERKSDKEHRESDRDIEYDKSLAKKRDLEYNKSLVEKNKYNGKMSIKDDETYNDYKLNEDRKAADKRAESAHLNALNQHERERMGREEAYKRSESINKATRRGKSDYARINNMKKLSKTAVPDRISGSFSMNEDIRRAHNNAEKQRKAEIRARRAALEASKSEKKKKEKRSLANAQYYRGKR